MVYNSETESKDGGNEAMNDDDLKPPTRRTVLPPSPMPSLDDAEEVEEAEDEEEEEDEEEDEESGF